MLKTNYDLLNEIKTFMESKRKLVSEYADLAFLVDLTVHLNELDTHLQGENQLIFAMF